MNTVQIFTQDWSVDNQQYLVAMLSTIKERLEWYKRSISGKASAGQPDRHTQLSELQARAAEMVAPPAIVKLVTELGLSVFERDVLLLCAGVELDSSIAELVQSIQGELSVFPSFSLALAALAESHWTALTPAGPLRYWRLLEVNKSQLLTLGALRIDEHVLHYLAGAGHLNEKLKEIISPVNASGQLTSSHGELAEQIARALSKDLNESAPPLIQLEGSARADRLNVAFHAGTALGLELHSTTASQLPGNQHECYELCRLWNRERALNGYALYIDCDQVDRSDRSREITLAYLVDNLFGVVIISGSWSPDIKRLKLVFAVSKPSRAEQMNLWRNIHGAIEETASLERLVSQFNLSSSAITRIGQEVHFISDNGAEEPDESRLWKMCCDHTRPQINELAERIVPMARWNDIVIPDEQKTTLRAIAEQVKSRNKVYEQWGFGKQMSRGLGISVMFAGESGTGKTMAAEVVANDLQLDLYKVDLSKVVSKYIGETEKQLSRIFDAAEDGGAVLLFDEADALFGKRSEVKDSHDRYSNIEVSYLLQRMESYQGLAILTTNMRSALDKAFLRRIRFVIQFPFPDAELRMEIWKKTLPEEVKHKLDFGKLAKLNLSGGSIRNIALNAAFFAASEGEEILMSHVARAAKAEYDKMEKTFSISELKF